MNFVDQIKKIIKILDSAQVMDEDTLIKLSTNAMLESLPTLEKLCVTGVKTQADLSLAKATMNWAAGVLIQLRDGKVKLMKVRHDK